ncbi:MAG TPA: hypothetical protein VHT52_13430 [Stellaceae bacterium]|nr:hypothetical protein [Stellaceae bacterium]
MSARIAAILAMAVAATLPGVGAKGACAVGSSHRCADTGSPVNLNSVSDIASKIVNEEPISANRGKLTTEPTAPAPYTGPIVGVTSGKPAPKVGYSWSLE